MNKRLSAGLAEGALLAAVAFGPLAFGAVEAWSRAILETLIFLTFMLRPEPRLSLIHKTFFIGLMLVVVIGVIQVLHPIAVDGPRNFFPFSACAPETRRALLLWASYAVLVWTAPGILARPGACQRLAWTLLLVGFAVSVIGLVQLSQGNLMVYGFRPVRMGRSPFGPYFNRAHAASLLAMASAAGGGLLSAQTAKFRRERPRSVSERSDALAKMLVTGFLLVMSMMGLLATRNRGALISIFAAAIGMAWLSSARAALLRRQKLRLAIAGVVLGAAFLAPKILGLLHGAKGSVPMRLVMYRDGLKAVWDAPVWGTGLGSVQSLLYAYTDSGFGYLIDHVHNDWLELLIQAGVIGVAAYTIGLWSFLMRLSRWWTACPSLEERCLAGGALIAVWSFITHGFSDFSFQIPANALIFILLLCWLDGQMSGRVQPPRSTPIEVEPARTSAFVRLPAIATALCLIALTIPPAMAERYFNREDYRAAFRWEQGPKELYGLAWSEYQSGDFRQAIASAERGRRMDSWNPNFQSLSTWAQIRLEKSKRDSAE